MANKAQMWALYRKATQFHRQPSSYFPELLDEWTIYQFDSAVLMLGTTIENALHERKEVGVGSKKEWRQMYELEDLLSDDFRLPRPPSKAERRKRAGDNLRALAGNQRSGVKVWKQRKPGELSVDGNA